MHAPPPSFIHLQSAPPRSIHLHAAHFNLHPAHFSLYIALSTSLELKYRTIARNWAISPNIAEKNGVLEVLIPNPNLDFWNSNPRIHFWINLGQKSESYLFYLKIGTCSFSRMLILIPTLVFWIFNPKSIFGQIWIKKSKLSILPENCHTWYLEDAYSYSDISFLNFKT